MTTPVKKQLSKAQREDLLGILGSRFEKNRSRHKDIDWSQVRARLEGAAEKLWTLSELERTGGEPDVIGRDAGTGAFLFVDCAAESPKERRSLCYDRAALDERKEHKPAGDALTAAAAMGASLLDEAQYRALQAVGSFDTKTSSWLLTPPEVRRLGGAIFGDRRYDRVFIYHNGASSYYAARGFRCCVWI
ncbi:DUF4256 domain-containing protein [Flaviaesturariibacter flavus]|uniref:DUF4256 domain-containing protein n=1 Tax=Flaviaesturariibacter flavus TaxID=2502780 RepID=A0A4R1BMR7_9BACT|nr:DUF4256 domain-containing protein [Flaviaesturariibacter flavus]TCJ18744.1 DUF4256 domain-containing protein [Flaviaesturariibacter flavus]